MCRRRRRHSPTAQPPKRPSSSSTQATEAQEHLPHSTIRPILTLWRIRSDPLSACHSSSCSEELPRDYNRNRENANSGLRVFISSSQLCTVCRGKNSKLNETHHPFPGRSWKKNLPFVNESSFLGCGEKKRGSERCISLLSSSNARRRRRHPPSSSPPPPLPILIDTFLPPSHPLFPSSRRKVIPQCGDGGGRIAGGEEDFSFHS